MQLQSHDTLDFTVYIRVKEMIINKELMPNELIIQNSFSQQLGVSRTPLRKALAQLEKEGLLKSTPKGWHVKEFTLQDMISVFRIRAVLEGLACRLAVDFIEPPELTYLKALFEHAFQLADSTQSEAYYQADIKFHHLITEASNDPLLIQTITSNEIILTSQIQGLYRSPAETYSEHMQIIEAIGQRDGKEAERLMQEHIEKAIPVLNSGKFSVYK